MASRRTDTGFETVIRPRDSLANVPLDMLDDRNVPRRDRAAMFT